jgi:abhydrolase domain-containing protein 6
VALFVRMHTMFTFIDLAHRAIRVRYRRAGFATGIVPCGGFSVHYYEHHPPNARTTLVLVHGLGTSSSTWAHILPELAGTCNILAPDLPGFGFTRLAGDSGFAHFDELYEALVAFVRQKASQPVLLLGHSLGGWLAAKLAANNPGLVKHLVLVDNAGILDDDTVEQGKAFQVESITDLRSLLDLIWFRYPWYFRPFYPAVLHDLRDRHVAEFVRSIQAEDFLNGDLHKLTMEVSILWGKQDKLISMKSVETMQRLIPRAYLHLLDQCGHVPQLERPKEFMKIVREILQQQVLTETEPNRISTLENP